MHTRRIAILGAGPVGLEAALALRERGEDVHVYERDSIGANLDRWGHVRLFSPFAINHSARGARVLSREAVSLPGADAYLTGSEHVDRYLKPLASAAPLSGRVHERTEVLAIGRDGIGKNALIGGPRDLHPFRLLVQTTGGEEDILEANVVIDCTGTYGNPNWMGNGNVPAKGERGLRRRIHYHLLDVTGAERNRFEGRRVLLVGSGHSAATALDGLMKLPGTSVEWIARRDQALRVIENDPLPERERLSVMANGLAEGADARVRFHPGASIESVRESDAGFEVEIRTQGEIETLAVDEILAHVGYHPDNEIYRELQVHECYASAAPMKLAAALLGDGSTDCLQQTSKGAETLVNPEPGFFILGAKSYGRNSNFLIRIGLEQIEELLTLLFPEENEKVS